MSDKIPPMLKKGIEIAQLLNGAGLPMKECSVGKEQRIPYTRGDKLIEIIGKKLDKIAKIYEDEGQTHSPISIAQRLLRENLIVKLERVHGEKKYYWPRELAPTNVFSLNRLEYGI